MANSNTEHSRKLRVKTAQAHVKKLLESGTVKQFTVRLPTETADELNAILAEIGGTKTQAIKTLCEMYHNQK